MQARPDRQSLKRATRHVAGRILAYYKNMNAREFLLYSPWLFLGSPFKLTELGWQRGRQMRYLLPAIGVSFLGEVWALTLMPRLWAARRAVLAQRRRDPTWFWRHITRDQRPPLAGYSRPSPPLPPPPYWGEGAGGEGSRLQPSPRREEGQEGPAGSEGAVRGEGRG
jgi:hypothetical protein